MSVQESLGGRGGAASSLAASPPVGARAGGAPELPPLRVPVRPALAPGVVLAGRMRDSGYRTPPWLLEREGVGYVQVTELLYRIAEQMDGERTHAEIAESVSAATGRGVSAENVAQLLAAQFLAKGLIADEDGRVAVVPTGRSLLAIRMKTRAVPPAVVNRAAAPLRALFLPPVMLAILAAVAVVQVWIFTYHGVASAVHQTFYTSGLALAVLALVVLAAAIHEFGHAAALKYGGGAPGSMGVGLYLVYPAFYTDVTDNYRLSRWGRLRTDLGGFYFNVLFVLALAGLYLATGWEFLILVIVIIDFQIVHQLLPFVRMDGYWTLVDLTGLPDFFQQIPAFFKSLVPRWFPGQAERPASPLKWWARVVLAAYLLVTVPLLAFLLLITAVSMPRILATALDAARQQAEALATAVPNGDFAGMVLHPLQLLLVLLPVVGVFLVLSGAVRRLAAALLKWSEGSPGRRTTALAAGATAVGLMLFAWMPGLALPGRAGNDSLIGGTSFTPIGPHERGTISDSGVVFVRAIGAAPQEPGAPRDEEQTPDKTPEASPSPTPSASTTPGTKTPSATASASASASPSTTPSATPQPTGTSTPASPTTIPTATAGLSTPEPSPTGGS